MDLNDASWITTKNDWQDLRSVGMIKSSREIDGTLTTEYRYYISSKELTAKELIFHTRNEWGVESMHWLLDVDFDEDKTRILNLNAQENLNILRKSILNLIGMYKTRTNSKKAISSIMRNCLFDTEYLLNILDSMRNIGIFTK